MNSFVYLPGLYQRRFSQAFGAGLVLLVLLFRVPSLQAESQIPLQVQGGTSLIKLANQYCKHPADWHKIAKANNLKSPYIIIKNSTITIPEELLDTESIPAHIGAVSGKVHGITTAGESVEVRTGDVFSAGMTLITDSDSHALLLFPDQKFIRLEPQTRLKLTYSLRLKDGTMKIETLLEQGNIINTIDNKLKLHDSFRSRTPTALAGVRGTEFRLKNSIEGVNLVETLRGEVAAAASNQERQVPAGKGVKIRKNQPPDLPRPLPQTPAQIVLQDVYKSQPLVLSSPRTPASGRIQVKISRDQQGLQNVLQQSGKAGDTLSIMLPEDGHYFAHYSAIDSEGFESIPSKAFPFYLRTVPGAPVLTAAQNSTVFTRSVPFTWMGSEQAATYMSQLSTDQNFSPLLAEATTKEPNWTSPELPPGTYYFRVQAVADDGFTSLFSEPLALTVALPPSIPDTRQSAGEALQLRWNAMGEKVQYDLELAEDVNFQKVLTQAVRLASPEYTVPEPLAPGSYYLRVRGTLENGQQSPWSPAQTLHVSPPPFGLAHKLILGVMLLCIVL